MSLYRPVSRAVKPGYTARAIRALREEAGAAGDLEQVELCDRALAGNSEARKACMAALNAARAQVQS